jgi:hypothetical protein
MFAKNCRKVRKEARREREREKKRRPLDTTSSGSGFLLSGFTGITLWNSGNDRIYPKLPNSGWVGPLTPVVARLGKVAFHKETPNP